ncbi:MAG: Glyoxalase/bleomycin resistance protein/dioxygenase [Blastococcus sp.]|nr:Glyoxalase/bleomycin resistance protein/dioxygenase [Blastococcus sp.]
MGLRVGDSEFVLTCDAGVAVGEPVRVPLSVEVDDVDALLPRVPGRCGAVQGPSNDMPWGQRVAHVSDPDGNAVNLTQQLRAGCPVPCRGY